MSFSSMIVLWPNVSITIEGERPMYSVLAPTLAASVSGAIEIRLMREMVAGWRHWLYHSISSSKLLNWPLSKYAFVSARARTWIAPKIGFTIKEIIIVWHCCCWCENE